MAALALVVVAVQSQTAHIGTFIDNGYRTFRGCQCPACTPSAWN